MRNTIFQVTSLIILLLLCLGAATGLYLTADEPGGSLAPVSTSLRDYCSLIIGNKLYLNNQLGLYSFILINLAIGLPAGGLLSFCTSRLKKPYSYIVLALLGTGLLYLSYFILKIDQLAINNQPGKYLIVTRAFISLAFYFILTLSRRTNIPIVKSSAKYLGIILLVFISMQLALPYSLSQGPILSSYYEHLSLGHTISYLDLNPLVDYSPRVNLFNSLSLLALGLIICIIYWTLERTILNTFIKMKTPGGRELAG